MDHSVFFSSIFRFLASSSENHVKSFNFRAHHLLLSTTNRLSREKFTQTVHGYFKREDIERA
ncbi:hypothetical protein KSP40_PGU009843 [Platanthera guangdongensis]|uniref:Uncharacterized protein n=1 Tax=Platanthera guangdongensis TaxID=2320717 RepID=A0ABR2LL46_9ASPA